jgi:regulator of extracellular matrix RemA (YlzA/DUF370 family)
MLFRQKTSVRIRRTVKKKRDNAPLINRTTGRKQPVARQDNQMVLLANQLPDELAFLFVVHDAGVSVVGRLALVEGARVLGDGVQGAVEG